MLSQNLKKVLISKQEREQDLINRDLIDPEGIGLVFCKMKKSTFKDLTHFVDHHLKPNNGKYISDPENYFSYRLIPLIFSTFTFVLYFITTKTSF